MKKILSFFFVLTLSAAAPSFAEQTRYRFTAASALGFEARSTLHPFTGQTRRIAGDFWVDWDKLPLSRGGFLELDVATLDTGNGLRDKKMKGEHLQTGRFPKIRFESTSCVGLTHPGGEPSRVLLSGHLELHGVLRKIEIPITVSRNGKNCLQLFGEIPLRLSDYGIPIPSVLGLIKMEDEVNVSFHLEAEPVAEN